MQVTSPAVSPKTSLRFWYGASIAEFVDASAQEIVGQLTLNSSFDVDRTQAAAWLAEIEFLQPKLSDLAGSIFFEFNIPRMGRRIDPLVKVLREALTRDEVARRKKQGEKVRKGKVGESVKAFIQNVHHFRDDALIDVGPPIEHVVIFDEARGT